MVWVNQDRVRTFSVLAMPGNGRWSVYLPEANLAATVLSQEEIETTAMTLAGNAAGFGEVEGLSEDGVDEVRVKIDVLPPLTTYPIPMKWLSQAADDKINPALGRAYCWADYPGQRTGDGRWVDLFWDEDQQIPLGRLWTDDNNGCGLLFVEGMGTTEYTAAALLIRHLHRSGVLASLAFEVLRSCHPTGPVHAGPLGGIADLGIEHNRNFLNGPVTLATKPPSC